MLFILKITIQIKNINKTTLSNINIINIINKNKFNYKHKIKNKNIIIKIKHSNKIRYNN